MNSKHVVILLCSLLFFSCGAKEKISYPASKKGDVSTKLETVSSNLNQGDSRCPYGGKVLKVMLNGEQLGEDIVVCNNDSHTDIIVEKSPIEDSSCKIQITVNGSSICVYTQEDFDNEVADLVEPETPILPEDQKEEVEGGLCSVTKIANYAKEGQFKVMIDKDSPVNLNSYTLKVVFASNTAIESVHNNNGGNSILSSNKYELSPINGARNTILYVRSSSNVDVKSFNIESLGKSYKCDIEG